MALRLEGYVELPEHRSPGGFDHAAAHRDLRRMFVAHTANDAIDIIDLETMRLVGSIDGLTGVAGALVAESRDLMFSSNRGEDTIGIFDARDPTQVRRVPVGRGPNGLAFDPDRRTLLAANVGDADVPASHTLTVVDADRAMVMSSIPVSGRTRWAVFDPALDRFFVNIADPPSIVVVDGAEPTRVAASIGIPAAGPHGLEVDAESRLYCACDAARLVVLSPPSYDIVADLQLTGSPDVIFLDGDQRYLYVAIGDPGVIEVFDIDRFERIDKVATEPGAHTIGVDSVRQRVYAFLPASHRAAVFVDV